MLFARFPGVGNLDPYLALNLPREAGQRDVEVSFHRLMTRRPPPCGDERRRIEEAYIVLSDPDRRRAIDRMLGLRPHPGLTAGSEARGRLFFESGRRAQRSGRWHQACRSFDRAVACQPWVAEYRSHLGFALAHLGADMRRARELCLDALRLDPSNQAYRGHLAFVYERLGLRKRASRVLNHSSI